jgi:DNA-binding LytR/AlgR family response regulator
MNVVIAEDEPLAADRLIDLMKACDPAINVLYHADSVDELLTFFRSGKKADLLMLDIQLADGKSFELFDKIVIDTPVIFTTAYDQYAIQAFKHHSIDYLLKPVKKNELQFALTKFNRFATNQHLQPETIDALKDLLNTASKKFKERFIIKSGSKLHFKQAEDVAYFFADGKESYLVTKSENRKHIIDHTLEELEALLDPSMFFRISRKFIVNINGITEVKGQIARGLELKLNQPCEHDLSISRDRAQEFKNWLDR